MSGFEGWRVGSCWLNNMLYVTFARWDWANDLEQAPTCTVVVTRQELDAGPSVLGERLTKALAEIEAHRPNG